MVALTAGLGRALGIRPGDGGPLLRVAALFALLEFGRGFGEIGVDTLVARQFGPTGLPAVLPFLYIGLGAPGWSSPWSIPRPWVGSPVDRCSSGCSCWPPSLIVLWRVGLRPGIPGALPALWLTVYLVGAMVVTVYWTVAGATFDARQAKRLFPLLTASAIAG